MKQLNFFTEQHGYTMTELLLVIAIITIVTGIAVPIYASVIKSSGLDVTTNTLVQDLYQAQINSRSEARSSAWGVAVKGQTIVLYAGSSYATRTTAYDSVYTMPATTLTSGLSEVDYSKLYGLPLSTGTFSFTSGSTTRTVTVNLKGMVDY